MSLPGILKSAENFTLNALKSTHFYRGLKTCFMSHSSLQQLNLLKFHSFNTTRSAQNRIIDVDSGQQHFPLEGTVDDSLFNTTFVVVDLETTGLKAKNDHIIEIGAIKTRGGKTIGTFSSFIDPGMTVSYTHL